MTSTDAPTSAPRLCNHAPCRCEVAQGETYCGDYCRKEPVTGMETTRASCRCRHPPCGAIDDPAVHT